MSPRRRTFYRRRTVTLVTMLMFTLACLGLLAANPTPPIFLALVTLAASTILGLLLGAGLNVLQYPRRVRPVRPYTYLPSAPWSPFTAAPDMTLDDQRAVVRDLEHRFHHSA